MISDTTILHLSLNTRQMKTDEWVIQHEMIRRELSDKALAKGCTSNGWAIMTFLHHEYHDHCVHTD